MQSAPAEGHHQYPPVPPAAYISLPPTGKGNGLTHEKVGSSTQRIEGRARERERERERENLLH